MAIRGSCHCGRIAYTPRCRADRGDRMQLLDLPEEGLGPGRRRAGPVPPGDRARRHRGLHLRPARHPPSVLQELRLRAVRRGHRPRWQGDGRGQSALRRRFRPVDGQDPPVRRRQPVAQKAPPDPWFGDDGQGVRWHAEDHPVPLVRQPGRGGDAPLRLDLQEFEGREDHALRGCRARAEGQRHGRTFELEGQQFVGPERRPALQVHRGDLVRRELRDAGRGGRTAGRSSARAASVSNAAGSRTSSACPGRSSPPCCSRLLNDPDPEKSGRVMAAMMQMTKIDIAKLKQAYQG